MSNRNTQGFPSPEEDPRFHDTYQFLRRYRDATYSLKVVVHQMEHQFKLQYDNDIDKFLDSIYAAGADLTGSDIEQRAKSIARSNQMLKLLESSIDLLRNNHKHGEQYYWILYYAFLSPQEMKNTDEILDKLAHHITYLPHLVNKDRSVFPTAPITGNAGLRLKHSVPSFGDLLQKRHWIRSTSSFQSNTYRLSSRLFVIS